MSDFKVGDRVVYHGDNKTWRGKSGTIRYIANDAKFALVVPDQGLAPGFDVHMSLVDIHHEKSKS